MRIRVSALFLLALSLTFMSRSAAEDKPAAKGERVFVCGHSFHVFIGTPLEEFAEAAKLEGHAVVGTQSIGGSRVTQHWDLVDEKNKAKAALKTGKVDVLTLSPHVKIPDEGVDRFTALALEHNPNIRVLVQGSWYPYDLPGNNTAKFKNADRDSAKPEDLRKAYEPFYTAMSKQVKELNAQHKKDVVFLVPVGHAVVRLRELVAEGKVPGVTKQSELFLDSIGHGRQPVAALAAYCMYAAIYKQSPAGLPAPKLLSAAKNPAYDDKFNRLLQDIAWDAVRAEPLAGVVKKDK